MQKLSVVSSACHGRGKRRDHRHARTILCSPAERQPSLVRKPPRKTPAPPSQAGRGKFVWDHRMTGPEGVLFRRPTAVWRSLRHEPPLARMFMLDGYRNPSRDTSTATKWRTAICSRRACPCERRRAGPHWKCDTQTEQEGTCEDGGLAFVWHYLAPLLLWGNFVDGTVAYQSGKRLDV